MELREIGKPKEAYVDEKCCLYSYVITRDYGFAPNPFGGICTLATCKPGIRNHAKVGYCRCISIVCRKNHFFNGS